MSDEKINELTDWKPIAKALGLKESAFWTLMHEQGLPHYKINPRVIRFRWSEVEKWLQERRVN